jgi:hypothetical protein
MKLRNGFVSNSSSASYTIFIDAPLEDFADLLAQYLYSEMESGNLIDLAKKRLQQYVEYDSTDTRKKEHLEQLIKFVDENGSAQEKLQLAFELNGVKVETTPTGFSLYSYTTMHNNYMEGIPDILKEIVMLLNFEIKDIKMSCKVEHD